jgi:hypothetical protein
LVHVDVAGKPFRFSDDDNRHVLALRSLAVIVTRVAFAGSAVRGVRVIDVIFGGAGSCSTCTVAVAWADPPLAVSVIENFRADFVRFAGIFAFVLSVPFLHFTVAGKPLIFRDDVTRHDFAPCSDAVSRTVWAAPPTCPGETVNLSIETDAAEAGAATANAASRTNITKLAIRVVRMADSPQHTSPGPGCE